jgi:hypothetical protein
MQKRILDMISTILSDGKSSFIQKIDDKKWHYKLGGFFYQRIQEHHISSVTTRVEFLQQNLSKKNYQKL